MVNIVYGSLQNHGIQVVRDLAGSMVADEHVGHRFTLRNGLMQAMEVCSLPPSALGPDNSFKPKPLRASA
jgi:hypothetical protein